MAFDFEIVSDEEQTRLNNARAAKSRALDLTEYKIGIGKMMVARGENDHSPWARIGVPSDSTAKAERVRMAKAAKSAGAYLEYSKDSTPQKLIVRLRPAPKGRAKRSKAETNGPVVAGTPAPTPAPQPAPEPTPAPPTRIGRGAAATVPA